jgi:hypothetical protein
MLIMDLEEIIKAVENDKNSHILNLTTVKNHKIKININKLGKRFMKLKKMF